MVHVIKSYEKLDNKIIEKYREQAVATVYEAAGQVGMMDPAIRPVYPEAKLCGSALTVFCHIGDNLMIHKAVSIAKPGDVLVVSIRNDDKSGAWGEILTTAATQKGIVGLVTDGSVRDAEATKQRDFPIFSRGLSIGATMKKNLGLINHPITCGNVLVEPGDIILGDMDGVVVVPKANAEEVLSAAIEREEKEAVIMNKLTEGQTTLEILGLNEVLKNLGLVEEE